jgi:hypothetical protein
MPSINGVDFNDIISINGVAWNSVTNIGGVPVSHAPSCTPLRLGYSDGRRNPPSDSCLATPQFYDFDATNNLLYTSGGCGTTFAVAGYYSDGVQIFFWDGASSFTPFGACGR